jgi:HAD superfamily hydrolase (TIGR01450 family)
MTASSDLAHIRLFLFDIDGVFLAGKSPPRLVSGTRVVPALRQRHLPFRLVTNTSTDTREQLAEGLRGHGIAVEPSDIHSALDVTVRTAAARYPAGRCFVFGEPGLGRAAAAAGLELVEGPPADVVLVGLNRFGDYRRLSQAARCVRQGAALLGCHRNRMWHDDDGPAVSCGPWLAALEQATGSTAEIFGKPSSAFYADAQRPFGIGPEATLMVGDDLEGDIAGAQRLGMRTALVLTGTTSRDAAAADWVLAQVDDLVSLLPQG